VPLKSKYLIVTPRCRYLNPARLPVPPQARFYKIRSQNPILLLLDRFSKAALPKLGMFAANSIILKNLSNVNGDLFKDFGSRREVTAVQLVRQVCRYAL